MTPRLLRLAIARARGLAAALLLALVATSGLLGAAVEGLAGPDAVLATGPLPACRYDDILTSPRAYESWATTLVDTILRVPKSYVPPDLTSVSAAGIGGTGLVREIAIPDLTALATAAKAAGNPLAIQSAYRSYATQASTFAYWVNLSGYRLALLYSARPGHSEHQLGLAIDFKSDAGGPPWSGTDWGTSPAGSWLLAHGWEYGFVQSYPKGKEAKTCYDYESWHYRYVGRDLAAAIHASGLTVREYLWRHFTTAAVPAAKPSPGASPGETASAAPSADASAGVSPEPSSTQVLPSLAPDATASIEAGSPEAASSASPAPTIAPAGTWLGMDPTLVAVITAVVLAILLLLALTTSLARRRERRRRRALAAAADRPPPDPDGP